MSSTRTARRSRARSEQGESPSTGNGTQATRVIPASELVMGRSLGTAIAKIDPDTALAWLGTTQRNRPINERAVRALVRSAANGEWEVNAETIKFDKNGHLIDGQHRLLAIIEHGKALPSFVAWGLDPKAQDTVDIGTRRKFAHVLAMDGFKRANETAALASHLWAYEQYGAFGVKGNDRATYGELYAIVRALPQEEIDEAVSAGARVNAAGLRIPTSLGAALYLKFKAVDAEDAAAFFESLRTGADLPQDDPIFALRRAVQKLGDANKRVEMDTYKVSALTIKAWNKWRAGATVTTLMFRPGGASPEPYPMIEEG